MKIAILAILALAVAAEFNERNAHLLKGTEKLPELDLYSLYSQFTKEFERDSNYESFATFSANLNRIRTHNSDPSNSYTMGVNKFSDLTWEQFKETLMLREGQDACWPMETPNTLEEIPDGDLPKEVDWREKDIVTSVKDQGSCGSCWAFATTAVVEARLAKETNWRINLSEQQVVDCARPFGTLGCGGGLPSRGFEYLASAGGQDTLEDYGYEGKDTLPCRFNLTKAPADTRGFSVNITAKEEGQMAKAVAFTGPIAISFEVIDSFRFYSGGVFSDEKCGTNYTDVNHDVAIVGYGFDEASGKNYWLLKNSWGLGFGVKGYFKLERDVNMCGVSLCASFPKHVDLRHRKPPHPPHKPHHRRHHDSSFLG